MPSHPCGSCGFWVWFSSPDVRGTRGWGTWEPNLSGVNCRLAQGAVSSPQPCAEAALQNIGGSNSTSCARSEGKSAGSLSFVGFELSYANKAPSAVELFTGWLVQALVTDLNELIFLTFIRCLPLLFPLQLLHVITGNLRISHLQKGTMKSNSRDIHFSLLSCLFWRDERVWWSFSSQHPRALLRSPSAGTPSSPLTQHRQDLAALQQLLRAFLAFKLLLMIMGDIHSNQSKHGFFLEALKKKCKWLFF